MIEIVRKLNELEKRLKSLEAIEASTKVVASYTTNQAQSISHNTETIVDFEDQVIDTHAAVTTGASWKFVAPSAGYYLVSVRLLFSATSNWLDGELGSIKLVCGSSHWYLDRKDNFPGSSLYMQLSGTWIVHAALSDEINVKVYQNTGSPLTIFNEATPGFTGIMIIKL